LSQKTFPPDQKTFPPGQKTFPLDQKTFPLDQKTFPPEPGEYLPYIKENTMSDHDYIPAAAFQQPNHGKVDTLPKSRWLLGTVIAWSFIAGKTPKLSGVAG
jgi:hypothetical protein